jgi:hypothetical protein
MKKKVHFSGAPRRKTKKRIPSGDPNPTPGENPKNLVIPDLIRNPES